MSQIIHRSLRHTPAVAASAQVFTSPMPAANVILMPVAEPPSHALGMGILTCWPPCIDRSIG